MRRNNKLRIALLIAVILDVIVITGALGFLHVAIVLISKGAANIYKVTFLMSFAFIPFLLDMIVSDIQEYINSKKPR